MESVIADADENMGPKFRTLNDSIGRLLEEYNIVGFVPLDLSDEESVGYVLAHVDNAVQVI